MLTEQQKEIETIKPRTITIDLSDADCERISKKAAGYGMTVGELLKNFIGDLVDGTYSNGSDERMYANQYCERCWYSWMNNNLLSYLTVWSDVDDFLTAWDEKLYAEEHPEEFEEERAELEEGEKLWFEAEIDDVLEEWKPNYKVDMDEEIATCRKWLAEQEAMKEGITNGK